MSEHLEDVAPEADLAVPADPLDAPGEVEAVDTESAELRKRFNGLMAKHQEALTSLVAERTARLEAEARLQEDNTLSETNETLSEVQALRAELAEARLATAKAEALSRYPDAAPFADLIDGKTATEVEQVTRAFAERAALIKGPAVTEEVEDAAPEPQPAPQRQVVAAPVLGGGAFTPNPQDTVISPQEALAESRRIAHTKPDSQEAWDAFFAAKVVPDEAAGLA